MKKVFALVLSLMMILCSVSALATEVAESDTIVNGSATFLETGETGDADIDVRGEIRYRDEGKFDVSGEAATELWLQVEASGQIDVTVPLVLVFRPTSMAAKRLPPTPTRSPTIPLLIWL